MSTPASRRSGRIRGQDALHVAVIGGGISGLSTAWYLQQAQYDGYNVSYTVLEAGERWGGKVMTEHVPADDPQPFVIEAGPDSFLAAQKPWALDMARQLGLDDQLIGTNDDRRVIYILNNGQLTPMPEGVYLVAPTRLWPFLKTPLFSPWAKLRMGLDLVLPARKDREDESLADFIGRRLGQEAVDKLAEPLMAGIYNARADELSIMATFPRFREMERQHGSLIRGMLAGSKRRPQPKADGSAPPAAFVTFYEGTQVLIDALTSQLTGDLRLNSLVEGLARNPDDSFTLHLKDGETLQAHQVVLAVPAYVAAGLVQPLAVEAARLLDGIRYVSTATVSLAYDAAELDHPLDGHGVVIPASEGRRINALTWTSTKFDHRAPEDHGLIRAFVGGSRTPEVLDCTDEEIVAIVREELRAIMGVTAPPRLQRLYRWPQSTPQYDVGHLERVAAIERDLPVGLYITGSPYRGIGMPDCVRQGKETAKRITSMLHAEAPTL